LEFLQNGTKNLPLRYRYLQDSLLLRMQLVVVVDGIFLNIITVPVVQQNREWIAGSIIINDAPGSDLNPNKAGRLSCYKQYRTGTGIPLELLLN
jgi:hypothetical protein